MGAKPKMTKEKIKELEGYFASGLTDEEACFMADISRTAMNDYCKANEKWREKKEILKRKPIIKAKQNMTDKIIAQDYDATKWYLERKAKDEFSIRTEVEQNTNMKLEADINALDKLNELTS